MIVLAFYPIYPFFITFTPKCHICIVSLLSIKTGYMYYRFFMSLDDHACNKIVCTVTQSLVYISNHKVIIINFIILCVNNFAHNIAPGNLPELLLNNAVLLYLKTAVLFHEFCPKQCSNCK